MFSRFRFIAVGALLLAQISEPAYALDVSATQGGDRHSYPLAFRFLGIYHQVVAGYNSVNYWQRSTRWQLNVINYFVIDTLSNLIWESIKILLVYRLFIRIIDLTKLLNQQPQKNLIMLLPSSLIVQSIILELARLMMY